MIRVIGNTFTEDIFKLFANLSVVKKKTVLWRRLIKEGTCHNEVQTL